MKNQSMHCIRFRVTTRTFRYDSSVIMQAQAVMIPISIPRCVRFEILLGHLIIPRPSWFATFRSGKFPRYKDCCRLGCDDVRSRTYQRFWETQCLHHESLHLLWQWWQQVSLKRQSTFTTQLNCAILSQSQPWASQMSKTETFLWIRP